MNTVRKSIVTFAVASLLLSLVPISTAKAQGQPNAFTETWNYDGVHSEVNAGDSWEAIDIWGISWPYFQSFSTPDQDLYGDRHWKWGTHTQLLSYGSAWSIGSPPPGDHATADYAFLQSSGSLSINATAHAHIIAQGDYTGWPHWNVASCSHTLEFAGGGGLFGNKVKINLENASAGGSSTGSYGRFNVYLVMECTFYVKTLISKNPDSYSVEYKHDDIAFVASSDGWYNYPRWYLTCPSIASGEYGLVDMWNQIYEYDYSTLPPTEIGQKYVSNVGVGKIYIRTGVAAEVFSSVTAAESLSSAQLNIGKITVEEIHAPLVSTSPATDVTKTSATLNGSVTDDGGEACQYRFRYRDEKSDYLYTSWTGSVPTGESFSELIRGLNPNTTYYFSAQVKNSAGESVWGNERSLVARPPEIPVVSFKYDPQRPKPDEAIVFDASKSEDKDGWIVSYAWDFGDGTSASTSLPIYDAGKAYEMPGDYLITLTVTDNDGRAGTATSTIKVKPKEFMLTFDDGPIPGQTDSILLQLMNCKVDDEPVRAAFFMVGDPNPLYYAPYDIEWGKGSVEAHPDAVTRVSGFGHLIGNHSQHHAWFPQWSLFGFDSMEAFITDEISQCNDEIKKAIHASPRGIFRAPYLQEENYPLPIHTAARALGFVVVGGKVADGTFSTLPDIQKKAREILEAWQEEEPVVLIFHDNRSVTYNHIGEIVSYLQNEGYRLVHFDPARIPKQTMRP